MRTLLRSLKYGVKSIAKKVQAGANDVLKAGGRRAFLDKAHDSVYIVVRADLYDLRFAVFSHDVVFSLRGKDLIGEILQNSSTSMNGVRPIFGILRLKVLIYGCELLYSRRYQCSNLAVHSETNPRESIAGNSRVF